MGIGANQMAGDFDVIEETPLLGDILDDIAERMPEEGILKAMEQSAHFLTESIVDAIYSLAKNPKGGLADSYEPELIDTGEEVTFGVFSDLIYAKTQDEGDTLTPNAPLKWMAYPHRSAKSYVGIRWPRDFPKGKLNFALSSHDPNGTAYLFENGREKPVFILKKKVKIPGLRYLDKALAIFDEDVEKAFDENVGIVFKKGGF